MDRKAQAKFNLLTPKSKEQYAVEEERDNSLLYSTLLVFVGVLIFFGVFMFNNLFLVPRVASLNTQNLTRDTLIKTYNPVKLVHGELFIKSQTLSTVLSKRIDTEAIFAVADQMISGISGASVQEYGREKEGLFVFNLRVGSIDQISQITQNITGYESTSDFFIREVSADTVNRSILVIVSININATI